MRSGPSRRRVLQSASAGLLVGLSGCNYVTQRLARGNVKNTVEKTYEPGDLSASFSLKEGQSVAFGNEDVDVVQGAGDEDSDQARPYVSALFHVETGRELPTQNVTPPAESVAYVDGIGAPTDGEYVCAVVPSLPIPEQQTGTNDDPSLDRKIEVFGAAGSYESIDANPYPLGDAVDLLETARENVASGYDLRGGPLNQLGYPVPEQYYYLRHDSTPRESPGVDAEAPFDEEHIYVPGNKLFEFATVELVRARTVESLSDEDREEYVSRLQDLLPTLYAEYGLAVQYDKLLEQEDEVTTVIRDMVLAEMGTDLEEVAEPVTESLTPKIGDEYSWTVEDVREPTLDDPGMTAMWVLRGKAEIDISDERVGFKSIGAVLPPDVSPTFQLSLSVPFKFETRTTLNERFPVSFEVSANEQPFDTEIGIDYDV
ncbi:hypothetical protein [Halorientalis salina]|uniref:hypothetical protein n=1 Tax=Halorientalis salina TaxID=2932266 RepID=UPI0010AB5A4F|nr:hypothetical protein [Halorientalis salina]